MFFEFFSKYEKAGENQGIKTVFNITNILTLQSSLEYKKYTTCVWAETEDHTQVGNLLCKRPASTYFRLCGAYSHFPNYSILQW